MMNDNNRDTTQGVSRRTLLHRLGGVALALPFLGAVAQARAARWDDKFEMGLDVEINQADEGRYRRPYVAVWVEDPSGKSIRTLSLWVSRERRGPRWIPDLRRWYKGAYDKYKATGLDLIVTVSSPTRNPGKYTLVWDGKDDAGKLVDQGTYSVCIEAAREHGTYQMMRKELSFGAKPFNETLDGNVEIKGATIAYRKRK